VAGGSRKRGGDRSQGGAGGEADEAAELPWSGVAENRCGVHRVGSGDLLPIVDVDTRASARCVPRLVRFIGFLRHEVARWLSQRLPCRRLSRHRSDTCCNSPMQREFPSQTDARTHAHRDAHPICEAPASETTQSTKTDSGISALDQPGGSAPENIEELAREARSLFGLMWQSDRSLPGSPRSNMRLLLSETGTDSLPAPYILDRP